MVQYAPVFYSGPSNLRINCSLIVLPTSRGAPNLVNALTNEHLFRKEQPFNYVARSYYPVYGDAVLISAEWEQRDLQVDAVEYSVL